MNIETTHSTHSPVAGPLVSVVIPTYNCGTYLAEAIDSALVQTYRPLEIIVGDDGSTDDTAEVVKPYLQRHPDLVHYHPWPHAGLPGTRRRLMEQVRGELIANLDADDRWHPDKIMQQVTMLQAHPEMSFCHTGTELFGSATGDGPISESLRQAVQGAGGFQAQFARAGIMPSAAMWRRSAMPPHGFHQDLHGFEDYALFLEMMVHHQAGYLNAPLTYIRRRPQQMTSQSHRWIPIYEAHARLRLLETHADHLPPAQVAQLRQFALDELHTVAMDRYWHGQYAVAKRGFNLLSQYGGKPVALKHRLRAWVGNWMRSR